MVTSPWLDLRPLLLGAFFVGRCLKLDNRLGFFCRFFLALLMFFPVMFPVAVRAEHDALLYFFKRCSERCICNELVDFSTRLFSFDVVKV